MMPWGPKNTALPEQPSDPNRKRKALSRVITTLESSACTGIRMFLLRVLTMPAQLDIDPNHRPVNINAIVYKAPGVGLGRIILVFG